MKLRSAFNLLRLSRKPTKKEKDKEFDKVLEERKVDFAIDNSTDLKNPGRKQ